ncbi:MAG TPA: type II toxin-antitoxin system VapC family toxin [Actinomycetota bacterium]
MPGTFVIDASVVVEFLIPRELSGPVDRFIRALTWSQPIALVAPDLLFLEVPSALARLARRHDLTSREADQAVSRLLRLPIGPVPASGLVEEGWKLRKNVTIYDASYLALARGLEVPLVTADRRLAKAARSARIRAWAVDDRELETLLDSLETA